MLSSSAMRGDPTPSLDLEYTFTVVKRMAQQNSRVSMGILEFPGSRAIVTTRGADNPKLDEKQQMQGRNLSFWKSIISGDGTLLITRNKLKELKPNLSAFRTTVSESAIQLIL